MSIVSISLVGQNFIFNLLLMFSLLALVFELITGGLLFGFMAIIGFVFIFNAASVSWLTIVLTSLGVLFVLLEAFRPSKAIFFMSGNVLIFLSFFFQDGKVSNTLDSVIFVVSIMLVFLVVFFFYLGVRKVQTLKTKQEFFSLEGQKGTILEDICYAQINGAIWKITSSDILKRGDIVVILEQKDLILTVRKVI